VARPGLDAQQVTPIAIRGLVDPSTGLGTAANPAPMALPGDAKATVVDATNRTTTITTDRFGYVTEEVDPLGNVTQRQSWPGTSKGRPGRFRENSRNAPVPNELSRTPAMPSLGVWPPIGPGNAGVRIVAVDRSGREREPVGRKGSGVKDFYQLAAEFDLGPEGIQEYRLQTRPFERVEIPGIVLHNGPR
jgi:hypothetical protein